MTAKEKLVTAYRKLQITAAKLRGDKFPFELVNQTRLRELILKNRQTLGLIEDWLPPQLLEKSIFQYGVNAEVVPLLNLPLDADCAHSDLLTYFGRAMKEKLMYLELGVSVGKTLWQVMNTCAPCECWAFDIEEINPALEGRLVKESRTEWQGPAESIKKTPSSISRFIHPSTGSRVVYVCADIFDERAWLLLARRGFNLMLSDALHTSQALDFEWLQLTKFEIIHPREAVIMWDDLDGGMRDWFNAKKPRVAQHLGVDVGQVGTFYMNGWLGRREFPHRLGLAIKGVAPHQS